MFRYYAKIFALGCVVALPMLPSVVWALKLPQPIATDSRIRNVVYSPNEVFRFVGHYGYQSSIEFEAGEEIQTVSIGDSVAWQVVPSDNRLFIKPIEPDALTNMTVVTDKRTYLFELDAAETENIRDKGMIFAIRFVYPDTNGYMTAPAFESEMPNPEEEPHRYHFNYTISGEEEVSPMKIFDDGEFTYFEFADKNAELPAFFTVNARQEEALINYRMVGNYVVVERVAARFTLRRGADVVCVFNEDMYRPQPQPQDKQ
jgi:type IV secretion system protein VirB9